MYNYEDVFLDLCKGFSISNTEIEFYIKHYTVLEQLELMRYKSFKKIEHCSKGVPDEDSLLKTVISDGKWTNAKEKQIQSLKEEIHILNSKKRKIKDFYQIEPLYNTIEECYESLNKILSERHEVLLGCAEQLSDLDSAEYQLLNFCFKDGDLDARVFTQDDLDYLPTYNYNYLNFAYYNKLSCFNRDKLKNLCIQPFVLNLLSLLENYKDFFNKSPLDLTYNQLNFIKVSEEYAKAALEEPDALEAFPDNAEKMLMCFFFKRNGGIIPSKSSQEDDLFRLELQKFDQFMTKPV